METRRDGRRRLALDAVLADLDRARGRGRRRLHSMPDSSRSPDDIADGLAARSSTKTVRAGRRAPGRGGERDAGGEQARRPRHDDVRRVVGERHARGRSRGERSGGRRGRGRRDAPARDRTTRRRTSVCERWSSRADECRERTESEATPTHAFYPTRSKSNFASRAPGLRSTSCSVGTGCATF